MKTKILLGALAMPMFFAACSNEELMESPVNANLQNRIPLGEVTLNLDGINSRLALQEGTFNTFTWSDGDDLGASLIDVRNAVTYDADVHVNTSVMYNLTATPQTNYRYEYNGGAWTSNAAMVEGNYVFYMPYAENTNREAPMAVLPKVQNLEEVTIGGQTAYTTYNDVLENAKENGNIMAVAYKFLSAEGENGDGNKTISVNFKQLYATPLISIQNYARNNENQLTDLTIKKIVLSKENDATFTVKNRLNFTSAAGSTALVEAWGTGAASIVKELNTVLNPDNEEYEGGAWAVGHNALPKKTADLLGSYVDAVNSSHISKTITINVEDPITIAKEETFSFYAVIPGGDYATNNLKVSLVTTDDKQVDVVMPDAHINPGKRYAVGGYDAEGNVDAGASAFLAVTTMQLVNAAAPEGVAIASQAELYTAIATAQKVDDDDNPQTPAVAANLVFIPAEGVVLNDQVISMLNDKATEIASIKFNGNTTVSGLTTKASVPVTIQGNASLNGTVKTEVATSAAAEKIAVTGSITIAEGAKVELKGAIKGITNNGELTITDATSSTENIANNSILNLKAALTLSTKNLTNAAGAEINAVTTSAAITANKVTNNGTINVVKTDDITGTLSITATTVENKAMIVGANTLTVVGAFTNKADAELNMTAGSANLTNVFTNEGTVNVSEGVEFNANYAGSINKNIINNAGTLTINKNIGTINVTNSSKFGTSSTTVSAKYTNASSVDVWGNIYNPYAKTIGDNAMNGTACQYVWNSEEAYTGEVDWVESDGTFNAVKYNGATVSAAGNGATTELIYVEFNGNSKLAITAGETLYMPIAVQVNENELEIAGAAILNWATGAVLTVAKDAVLGWNDAVNFGTVTINNGGKVYGNAGTLTGIEKQGAGQWFGDLAD